MKNKEINFEQIHAVVETFYQKATKDILIGFKFDHIKDLAAHIKRISYFWQLQLTGKIDEPAHLPFHLIDVHRPMHLHPGMVDRWIFLFHQTLNEFSLDEDTIQLWKEKIELFRERMKIIQVSWPQI